MAEFMADTHEETSLSSLAENRYSAPFTNLFGHVNMSYKDICMHACMPG